MTSRITVEIDDKTVMEALGGLLQRLDDARPLMQDIGEYLVFSTKRRFGAGVGPDGQRWAPNSPVTLARKKGSKPLIGETLHLSSQIYAEARRDSVLVGSPMIYAATQQFGAARGAFGKSKRGGPIPWGDIPPRPFLGLDEQDQVNVLDIIHEYLNEAI